MIKKSIFYSLVIIMILSGVGYADVFKDADLYGDWNLKGKWYTIDYNAALSDGLIHINGSNKNVTDGIWKINLGSTSEVVGSQAYMLPDGTFVAEFTTESFGPYDFQGVMNENKDVIVNTEPVTQSEFDDNSLSFLVNTSSSYSVSDFSAGTWDLKAMWGSGTVESDGNNNITGGSFVNNDGTTETVDSDSSSYSINSIYGRFSATIVTNANLYNIKGAMNGSRSKDIIPFIKVREVIEHLTLGGLATASISSEWKTTEDFTLANDQAEFDSTEDAANSTLYQPENELAVPVVPNTTYKFTYTVSGIGGTGTPEAYISTTFASNQTSLSLDAPGTYTTTVTTADAPHDFTIVGKVEDDGDGATNSTGTFNLDDLSLKKDRDPASHYNLGILVKSIGSSSEVTSYSESDFAGTWQVKGMNYRGKIVSDGKGDTADDGKGKIINGSWEVTSPKGSVTDRTVTGDYYTINLDNGTFKAKIIAEDSEGKETIYKLQGVMNESKDFIACAIPPTKNPIYFPDPEWGNYYNLVTLVKNYAKKETGGKVEITNSTHNLYKVYCDIPSEALSSDKEITIDEIKDYPSLSSDVTQVGHVVNFGPTGLSFDKEVTLALTYPSTINTDALRAYKYDTANEEWDKVSISSIDSSNNRALIKTSSFSIYSLGTVELPPPPEEKNIFGHSDGAGDCFIATATYGTPSSEEVETLCDFRDEYLLPNPVGRKFVDLYYKYSPPIADYIKDKKLLKSGVRVVLKPLIWYCKNAFNLEESKTKKAGN